MRPHLIPVDDPSRVAEVRRLANACALAEGLDAERCDQVGIVATEIATNLLKHARSGQVYISPLSPTGRAGVELLSIDRGPGVANFQACLADGFSTTGTQGSGLGAISRLSDQLDVYSQPGRGTVLAARKYSPASGKFSCTLGVVAVPYPGEFVCGDSWSAHCSPSRTVLIVADGLGHGVFAAEASSTATRVFQEAPTNPPAALLEKLHLALRATRGAAIAVTSIDHDSGRLRHAGLGNIAAVLLGGPRPQSLLSHNGTAGHEARRFQEFEYPVPTEGVLVMHSDGLTANWSFDSYPGLLRRHPAVIAGILYRDATRGRDDACVAVAKWNSE
jgi:anti-sigma regulatory factor (Ser/Thr protein kinase)